MQLDPKTTAFVFPGQGSQIVGMGRDLATQYGAVREVFDRADETLGFALSAIMWNGPEASLSDTINTQPALYVHSHAAFRVFTHFFPEFKASALAGHSLGELSALTVAGALSFEAGLRLVRKRGELMKRAGDEHPGSMAAILGLDIPTLEQVCSAASSGPEVVQVANDNCPGQVVISGAKPAVKRALESSKAAGAKRAIPLAVSIAAHSPLMQSIQDEWNQSIAQAGLIDAEVPVIGNVGACEIRARAELQNDIQLQMQSRVRWTESVRLLTGRGINTFVEIGTGNVLLGLIRRIAPSPSVFPLGTPTDFEALQ